MVTMVIVYQSDRNQVAYAVLTPPAFSETLTGITGELRQPLKIPFLYIDQRSLVAETVLF